MTTALVLGSAASVWQDIEAALDLGEYAGVVACNDAGAAFPGEIDAHVSIHPELFPRWVQRRTDAGLSPARAIYGHENAKTSSARLPACVTHYTDHRFPRQVECGSSGLFALKVALIDLGHDRAVLCGIPIAAGPHFFGVPFDEADHYRKAWVESFPAIKDRARSMSGWTRSLLGAPCAGWVSGHGL